MTKHVPALRAKVSVSVRGHIIRLSILVSVLALPFAQGSRATAEPSICEPEDPDDPVELVEPVEWCAVTTISAGDSGAVRMLLPEDASFSVPRSADGVFVDFGPGTAIDIAGEGRFLGFAITEDPPVTGGLMVLAGRVAEMNGPGEFFFDMTPGDRPCSGDVCTLRAGAYRLHLLVDAAPARVTLRFDGLRGAVELAPFAPVGGELRALRPHVDEENSRTVLVAGEVDRLVGQGVAFLALWLSRDAQVADELSTCFYRGEVPEPIAYLPGCPWPDEGSFTSTFTGTGPALHRETVLVLAGRTGPEDDRYALGASYVTASLVRDVGAVAWWLDLDPGAA